MLPPINVPSRTERQEDVPRDTRAPGEKCPARDILFVARGPDSYRGQPLVKMTGYDLDFLAVCLSIDKKSVAKNRGLFVKNEAQNVIPEVIGIHFTAKRIGNIPELSF